MSPTYEVHFFRVGSTGGVQFQLDTPTEAYHAATYGSWGFYVNPYLLVSDMIIWPTFKSKWWTKITQGFIPSVSEYLWDFLYDWKGGIRSVWKIIVHTCENDPKSDMIIYGVCRLWLLIHRGTRIHWKLYYVAMKDSALSHNKYSRFKITCDIW